MTPSSTATYHTHAGTFTLDRSQIGSSELATLDQLNAAGKLQQDHVLQFLDAHPDIKFSYVTPGGMEPPEDTPDEELPYEAMDADLNSILAQAQRAMMRANQGLRRTSLEQAMAQREQIMSEAKQGLEKDLKAAEKNYDAAVAGAAAEAVAGGVQLGGAAKGMKDMRASVKMSKRAEQAGADVQNITKARHEGLQRIEKEQARALDKVNENANRHVAAANNSDARIKQHHMEKAKAEIAKMPAIQKAAADDSKAFDRNMNANIGRLEKGAARDVAEAERLTKGSMLWGQVGTSVGQIINSVGKGFNAQLTMEAAELSAHSKMDHAEQEMASMIYQQNLDMANAARDVLNEVRNMQSSTSQSTQQLMSSIARNMA